MSERQKVLEASEVLISSVSPPWLGGLFEVGGFLGFVMRFSRRKGTYYEKAYPIMTIGENHLDKLNKLHRLLGGNFHSREQGNNSIVWYLQGIQAVWLAQHMEQYAPSRQETVLAFSNWENAESMEERVEIARLAREQEEAEVLTFKDYLPLVKNPGFFAGVLDSRGTIPAFTGDYPRLQVKSTNRPLLEALQFVYGGSCEQYLDKGEVRVIKGVECVLKKDSFRWVKYFDQNWLNDMRGQLKLLQVE
ncbi:hypothetical protein KKE48_04615 [Patescibacteria group bacterium]|nr:hypothetical protein [Patescibacteria group bacterium]MBU1500120.1 hypothetical protein [Patescibacteria group bacterium]